MPVPDYIARSPMMRNGGYQVVDGLLPQPAREAMLSEAAALYSDAHPSDELRSDGEELRGGNPARRFFSSPGGAIQDAFYQGQWLRELLNDLTRAHVEPTGQRGTFTYYVRPGDHLAIHRDIHSCDVAVVTCLLDTATPDVSGGRMAVYPDRIDEPLSAIRATSDRGKLCFRLEAGQTIVMFGGVLPHAILPLSPGQNRIVSVLCFRALEPL